MENEPKIYKEPPPPQSPFKWYMANWWHPLCIPTLLFLCILFFLLLLPTGVINVSGADSLVLIFIFLCTVFGILSLLAAFITGIIQLFKKRQKIAGSVFLGTFILFFLYFALIFMLINSAPRPYKDDFADNLKLPNDTELFLPFEIGVEKDPVPPQKNDLFLYEMDINITVDGDEPYEENGETLREYDKSYGVAYKADIWSNPGEPGMIYLKGFEITQELPLTRTYIYYDEYLDTENLKERTTIQPQYSKNPQELFCNTTKVFCIPEGEPGQFYGARFEVWFIPDSGEPERKLFEKNFKIQGCR